MNCMFLVLNEKKVKCVLLKMICQNILSKQLGLNITTLCINFLEDMNTYISCSSKMRYRQQAKLDLLTGHGCGVTYRKLADLLKAG